MRLIRGTRGAVAFVCSCQVICQFCQRDVKNASAEALSTSADFFAGWRLSPYPSWGSCCARHDADVIAHMSDRAAFMAEGVIQRFFDRDALVNGEHRMR